MATAPKPVKTRKARTRKPTAYEAVIVGSEPIIVVAHTQKDALAAVITLKPATHESLMAAGKLNLRVIDTTVPAAQINLVDSARDAA